ncbi:N-6 DNA methylase [Cupriavidus plantarum]|uniref:N-6 DNA methylase n=1 Tax=Cupriavidus plantarum TaxID=942865 RepID=UPI00339D30BB
MSRVAKRRFEGSASEPHKVLLSLFKQFGHRYSVHEVFSDFVEIAALSISNTVDRHHAEAREKRYEEIIRRYERVDRERFPQMFGALVQTFEDMVQGWVPHGDGLADVLGQTYMMLELGNDKAGQFFTPYPVSRLMARMNIGDGAPFVQRDGFVTLSEPACGAGGMVIACADALHDAGHNYQQTMHATCIDIDPRCVHMTYVQLALLHIPAIVIHGNALSVEAWSTWITPAHVVGGWGEKLRFRRLAEAMRELLQSPKRVEEAEGGDRGPDERAAADGSSSAEKTPIPPAALRVLVPDDQLALF